MYGWMDACMNGLMSGWLGGFMNGWVVARAGYRHRALDLKSVGHGGWELLPVVSQLLVASLAELVKGTP